MSTESGAGKVVCVTGASGYIASWLVKLLLNNGYTVKATVRDPSDPKRIEHLMALDGAKERLQIFKADLVDEGCFDAVVEGSEGVIHTASPVAQSSSNPQVELIDPEVPSATGRYLLVGRSAHNSEAMKILHPLFPTLTSSKRCEDYLPYEPSYRILKEKAESLGINFMPLEMSLRDTIQSLKDKNLLTI